MGGGRRETWFDIYGDSSLTGHGGGGGQGWFYATHSRQRKHREDILVEWSLCGPTYQADPGQVYKLFVISDLNCQFYFKSGLPIS
jgi:hypothetical protein